jgi:hypothetical protein
MRLHVTAGKIFSSFRECDCMSQWVRYFRSFVNATACHRGSDIFVLSWMRLHVTVGQIFSSFRECDCMSQWVRYFCPFVKAVGYRSEGDIFWCLRQYGLVSKCDRNFHPLMNTIGYWNGWDICNLSSVRLEVELRYFRPFYNKRWISKL